MPAVRHHPTTRHRDRRSNDPSYEKRVEEALGSISTGEYRSFRDAARAIGTGVRARQVSY
jgi:alkylated DNA nucleotide flippase Atl1